MVILLQEVDFMNKKNVKKVIFKTIYQDKITDIEQSQQSELKIEEIKPKRYTGKHQMCPRCGSFSTVVYKSMPVENNIRVQYRRCTMAICRKEFKTVLPVL